LGQPSQKAFPGGLAYVKRSRLNGPFGIGLRPSVADAKRQLPFAQSKESSPRLRTKGNLDEYQIIR
jgi:hypothetical protein